MVEPRHGVVLRCIALARCQHDLGKIHIVHQVAVQANTVFKKYIGQPEIAR